MKSRTSTCITAAALFAALAIPVGLAAQEQEHGQPPSAPIFTSLFSFDGTDGALPFETSLVQGMDGNLYGETGSFGFGSNGAGEIYKITPTGTQTVLYSFCSQPNCTDGGGPSGGLVLGTDGNFYGTTSYGGTGSFGGYEGWGTVFKITPSGTLTTVYNWCSQPNCTDGGPSYVGGTLVQATDGNFYGTNVYGGANTSCNGGYGCGTVFSITPEGVLKTLYNWCSQPNCADGSSPNGLVQATDGNFYGTTLEGGANSSCFSGYGCGEVFKITPQGGLSTLYSFCSQTNCDDGDNPYAGLIQVNGEFYGTTFYGGTYGDGTVFKLTSGDTLTTLYNFCSQSNCSDGASPYTPLIQATNGILYGTACCGGAYYSGVIFGITPAGTLTTLYSFCAQTNCADGSNPDGGLVQATNGTFYGTTQFGGNYTCSPYSSCGTIYSLAVGLGPFVETLPTSGRVGETIKILGNHLADATGVSFNGVAATFKVFSHTLLSATVPTGATTGFVAVTTPSGTLKSNVRFQVKP